MTNKYNRSIRLFRSTWLSLPNSLDTNLAWTSSVPLEFGQQVLSMLKCCIATGGREKMAHIRIISPCHDSTIAYQSWQKRLGPAETFFGIYLRFWFFGYFGASKNSKSPLRLLFISGFDRSTGRGPRSSPPTRQSMYENDTLQKQPC